ncbi:MAG: HEAT repeat domain-containing protein, partial [Gammaproteobacteria bacterium]
MNSLFEEVPDLDEIRTRLASEDGTVRRMAVMRIGETAEPEAVGLLVQALGDADSSVRAEAARVLDEFDAVEGLEGLVEALSDPNEAVRLAAAETLAENKS